MIDKIKNRPYYVLLVALAVFGIMLVTLSKDENVAEGHDENVNLFSESEYERALESRLEGLIEKIDGVGSVSVMITLSGSAKYTYAQNTSEDVDADGDIKKEVSIVMSNKKSNVKEAIVSGYTLPEIKGAAVVCEKKLSAEILKKVIGTVSASLGITTDKIYVTN